MKNRVSSTILFIAVAAIWGYIIYYIYDAVKGDEESTIGYSLTQKVAPKDSLEADFILSLDYPDPFLKTNRKPIINNNPPKRKALIKTSLDIEPDWNRIIFAGIIENKKERGKKLAIISIDGSTHFVSPNSSINELILLTLHQDSVLIAWQSKQKWIKKL